MTYVPEQYWQAAGKDPTNSEHESRFVRTDVFAEQERALMATLETLEFRSVLEVGCGFGRITRLVAERWPEAAYTAIDLSEERLMSAHEKAPNVEFTRTTIQGYRTRRKWDLVLAVETLMHVPPDEIEAVVEKLASLSRKHIVTLDWTADLGSRPVANWNFRHPYVDLYGPLLVSEEAVGLQSIFVATSR